MQISTVGVVGSGQMGQGIAQVAAMSGLTVVLQDLQVEALSNARRQIEASLGKLAQKGKIGEAEVPNVLRRLKTTQHLEELSDANLVIEAVTESLEVKSAVFKKLDSICRDGVILASNTSSISITTLGAQTRRPESVIGMHFMNPVPIMQLVELIRGLRTNDQTYRRVSEVVARMGKVSVESKDYPGFIVNRVLMPMINEACFALYEGLASAQDIDNAMKLGTNQPMGPLALADFIGLDTCLAILRVLQEGLGDPKYRACPLLRQYVAAGLLGRKTKRGFFVYE